MKKTSRIYQIKLVLLVLIFGALSVVGFNCGRPQFQVDQNLVSYSNDSSSAMLVSSSDKVDTAWALLTSEQVFRSMLSLTNQSQPTTAMINEYNSRAGGLGVTTNLNLMNGPMMIAVTSLAGIVCDGLITKEAAMMSGQRTFYNSIDFTKGPSLVSDTAYADMVSRFSNHMWGRDLDQDEQAIYAGYLSEFRTNLSATDVNLASQTKVLALSVCTSALSTFDSYTY